MHTSPTQYQRPGCSTSNGSEESFETPSLDPTLSLLGSRAFQLAIPVAGSVAGFGFYKYRLCSSSSPCTVELRLRFRSGSIVNAQILSLFQIYAADFTGLLAFSAICSLPFLCRFEHACSSSFLLLCAGFLMEFCGFSALLSIGSDGFVCFVV